jgi:hypothetical protein
MANGRDIAARAVTQALGQSTDLFIEMQTHVYTSSHRYPYPVLDLASAFIGVASWIL